MECLLGGLPLLSLPSHPPGTKRWRSMTASGQYSTSIRCRPNTTQPPGCCAELPAHTQSYPTSTPYVAWGPTVQCSAGASHRSCLSRPQAAEVYAEARRMCPYLVEDMAMYSSVLWHLRKVRDTR
jgi:hypothetical protein